MGMSQSEINGGVRDSPPGALATGRILPEFSLPAVSGGSIRNSDYRGRSNLVVIVADDRPQTSGLMQALADSYALIKTEAAEVLAIVALSPEQARERFGNLPYPVLVDADGRVQQRLGAITAQGQAAAALYVTDAFGEIQLVHRTREGQTLPAASEVVTLLEFINIQCPECEPPEWPLIKPDEF